MLVGGMIIRMYELKITNVSVHRFASVCGAAWIALVVSFFALPGQCLDPEPPKILPPSEWAGIPVWSHNGRFVKVNWPKPHYPSAQPNAKWEQTLILKVPSNEVLPIRIRKVRDAYWSPDDTMIAGRGKIFNLASGKLLFSFDEGSDVAWSPNGELIASGSSVWDVLHKKQRFTFPGQRDWISPKLAWSHDGTKLAHAHSRAPGRRNEVLWLYSSTGEQLLSLRSKNEIENIGWSMSLNLFAYSDDALHILDGTTLKELKTLTPATKGQVKFEWSPDGKLLAYSGEGADLHIFDASKMQDRFVTEAEKTGRFHVQWSPLGDYLLVGGADDVRAIFSTATGKYVGAKKFDSQFYLVRWAPDGKSLALCKPNEAVVFEPVRLQPGLPAFEGGTDGNPWRDQTVLRNIDDCFEALYKMLSADEVALIKNTTEDKLFLFQGGPSLGMGLRNQWGLRQRNPLTKYFNKMGIADGANMSSLIIELFWRHLNGKPLNLEERALAIKKEEDGNRYIIEENKPLPESLLRADLVSIDGKPALIAKLKGSVKVIAFIPDGGSDSVDMLDALASVRTKYPVDKVSIMVLKFARSTFMLKEAMRPEDTNYASELSGFQKANQSSITVVTGDAKIFEVFKSFVGDRVRYQHSMLPQTLIMTEQNVVATRVNGSVGVRNTMPLEDPIDAVLDGRSN
jgi:WD40 repeat protein